MKKSFMTKSAYLLAATLLLSNTLPSGVFAENGAAEESTSIKLGELHEAYQEQLNQAAALKGPAFISPKINTSSPNKVDVIIQFNEEPVAVRKYSAKASKKSFSEQSVKESIVSGQTSFLKTVKSKKVDVKVNYQYNTVLNGMEVTVNADQIPELAKMAGVKSIYENNKYHTLSIQSSSNSQAAEGPPYNNVPVEQIHADEAWELGYTGKGVKVGILDTGVDFMHPDLNPTWRGGMNFFDPSLLNFPYEERPLTPWEDPYGKGFAGTFHGTHVAGTIAGQAQNNNAEMSQKGVAYDASMRYFKVLGRDPVTNDGSGTAGQIIAGIEESVLEHLDVINMSLGGGDKNPDSPESIAVNNAVLAGVVVVVASGNEGDSGPYYYSMGTPASAQLAISVAAANSASAYYTTSAGYSMQDAKGTDLPGGSEPLLLARWNQGDEANLDQLFSNAGPLDAVYVGLGSGREFRNTDVRGKIAFISRGAYGIDEKVDNAKENGARAVVMFNGIETVENGVTIPNLSATIPGRDGPIGSVLFRGVVKNGIPTFDMAGNTGRAIAKQLVDHPGSKLQFTWDGFQQIDDAGDEIASFSSRGPNSDGNFSIKPDVSAPGVNVYSTWPAYGLYNSDASYADAYNRISGTSMAAPHVAGAAALVVQKYKDDNRDWKPSDVRAALANTSEELHDKEGALYDVYSQGAGRINVMKAIKTPALVEAMDDITIYDNQMNAHVMPSESSSVSFGMVEPGSDAVEKPLQLKNVSNHSQTYKVRIEMHDRVTSDPSAPIPTPESDDIDVTLSGLANGNEVTAEANNTAGFNLSAQAKPNAHGVYEGAVIFEGLEGDDVPALHLPFVIHVGNDTDNYHFGLGSVKVSDTKIAPYKNAINISSSLLADGVNFVEGAIADFSGNYIGTIAQMYDRDIDTKKYNVLPKGSFTFERFDGSYLSGDYVDELGNPLPQMLKDGSYQLELFAGVLTEKGMVDMSQPIHFVTQTIVVDSGYEPPIVTDPDEPGEQDPGEQDPGEQDPGEQDPGEQDPGEQDPGEQDPGEQDPGTTPSPNPSASPSSSPSPSASPSPSPSPSLPPSGMIPIGIGASPTPSPSPSPSVNNVSGSAKDLTAVVVERGQAAISTTPAATVDGKALRTTVSDEELQKALAAAKQSPVAFVIAASSADTTQAELKLTAAQVKLLKGAPANSSVVFLWNDATVSLPISALSGLSEGADLSLAIAEASESKSIFKRANPDTDVLGIPYSFTADAVVNGVKKPISLSPAQSIKRAFVLDKGINVAAAGALYEENGQVHPVPARFAKTDSGTTIVTITRPGFSTYAAAQRRVSFTDISASWGQNYIQSLAEKFILNGTTISTFAPKSNVTRAQFASMLIRALGLPSAQANGTFSDVKGSEWFAQDVSTAYAAGLVKGTNSKFNPNEPISRQDLTVMLARAIELLQVQQPVGSYRLSYADSSKFGSYAVDSIQAVTNLGLMEGSEKQGKVYFDPQGATTREAAAKVLYLLLQKADRIN